MSKCPSVDDVSADRAPVVDEESETITPFTVNEAAPVPPRATPNVPVESTLVSRPEIAVFVTAETRP